jgi:hypothetical protein
VAFRRVDVGAVYVGVVGHELGILYVREFTKTIHEAGLITGGELGKLHALPVDESPLQSGCDYQTLVPTYKRRSVIIRV